MTLNNLAEQLPWLLRNPSAIRPKHQSTQKPAIVFASAGKATPAALHGPTAVPASSRGDTLPGSSGGSSGSSGGSSGSFGSSIGTVGGTPATSRTTMTTVSASVSASAAAYPALPMPRPSLAQAPVPAPTRPAANPPPLLPRPVSPSAQTPARNRAALVASTIGKTPSKTPSKTPKKTSRTPAPTSLRKAKAPAHQSPFLPDFGSDINLEDFDSIVDLTSDGIDGTDGSSTVMSSANKRPPTQDVRLPPQLPPPKPVSRGKKRKSGDISGSPSAKAREKRRETSEHDKENTDPADLAKDEFDEFDSGSNFPDVNELLGFGLSSPITHRRQARSPKKSPLRPPSPPQPPAEQPPPAPVSAEQPPAAQPPPPFPRIPATPPKRRKRFSDPSQDVVMDSEDEFDTPLTRNTSSFVTCPNDSTLADATGAPSPLDVRSRQPNASTERNAAGQDASLEEEPAKEVDDDLDAMDDQVENDEMDEEATQRPSILAYWPALRWRQHGLDERLKKNTADYGRALREKWTPARRLQIKGEKEPLLKEKQVLDDLAEAVRAYARLFDDQETLFHAITVAYENHKDTEADEARLDQLSSELQERETTLRVQLSAAAIDPASVPNDFDAGSPHSTVVPATQVADGYVPPILSRNDTSVPESPSQVVLQTQLPKPAPPAPRRETIPGGFPDEEFDDDFFNAMAEDDLPEILASGPATGAAAGHSNGYSYTSRRSPERAPASAKRGGGAAQDFFSDFSDDIEMLQAAEDFEQQHSSGSRAAASRAALTPTSGNAGTPYLSSRSTAMPIMTTTTNGAAATKKTAAGSAGASAGPSQKRPAFPPELMHFPWSQDVRRALKDRFRMSGFRHNQLEAINATLAGKDAFVLMPTGGGKSLCYMLPAVVSSGRTCGVTIVISPLLSLMQDQVDHLKKLNIAASAFTSGTPPAARQHVLALFSKPHPEHFLQLLYVSPEMVSMSKQFCNGLATLYRNKKLARIVVDEAHCVSQWGHDFRPDYKAIGTVRAQFPTVPVMALTATATSNVIVDIQHNLRMNRCEVFSQSFNRPNLYYAVLKKNNQCVATMAEMIQGKYAGKTGIVYTLSQKNTETIAEKLQGYGISAHHYHAGMAAEEKMRVQREWQDGHIKVVVATIAFGMGIDKPDVRFVFHHHLPKSLEGYYQETGRAGRDGKPSECYLFYGGQDKYNLRRFIEESKDSAFEQKTRQRTMLNRMVDFADNEYDCRRVDILRYFGETFDQAACAGTCDNCRKRASSDVVPTDVTEYALAALRVVQAYRSITQAECNKILTGAESPDRTSVHRYFGVASHLRKQDVNGIMIKLLGETALAETNEVNASGIAIQHYRIGPRASEYFAGGRRLKIVIKTGERTAKTTKKKTATSKGDKTLAAKKTSKATASRKGKEVAQSATKPSSRKKRNTAAAAIVLDEADVSGDDGGGGDDSDGEAYDGPLHANGYAKDAFVVSDNDDDSGLHGSSDMDDDIAPPPPARRAPPKKTTKARQAPQQQLQLQQYAFDGGGAAQSAQSAQSARAPRQQQLQRQRRLEELGGPIARDARLAEAQVNSIHGDMIASFVDEARKLEEKVRNEKGLRILFTESHLREMVINWTDTIDKMLRIRSIDADHVRRFGSKFVPLVRRYHTAYREMMAGAGDGDAAGAGPSTTSTTSTTSRRSPPPAGLVAEFVDLISSDEEAGGGGGGCDAMDGDDDDDDDLDLDTYSGETASKYFAADAHETPEAAAWRAQLETLQSQSSKGGRGGRGGGGGRSYKGGGGGGGARGWRKNGGGNRPKKGSFRGRAGASSGSGSSGVTKTARKTSSSSTFGGGGSGSRGGGGGGGGGSGMSRIGMMPL